MSPDLSPDFVKFLKVEPLSVLISTSFDRQCQDWSCPANYKSPATRC